MPNTSTLDAESFLKRVLLSKTLDVLSVRSSIVESGIMGTIPALSFEENKSKSKDKACSGGDDENLILENIPKASPPKIITEGRPRSTRMKAWLASQKR